MLRPAERFTVNIAPAAAPETSRPLGWPVSMPTMLVAGFLGCLIWTFTLQRSFATHGIDSAEVGVVLSALVFIIVSRRTRPTPDKNLEIFFDPK